MAGLDIDHALAFALLGVASYFGILNARVVARYLRFRRMRHHALLVWPSSRPPAHLLGIALGIVSAGLAVIGIALRSQVPLTLSQAVTALYFLGAAPLLMSIRPGFYELGVWVGGDFVPYGQISRWAFHDAGSVALVIVRRGCGRALRLPVPTGDYGAVCKLLQQKAEEQLLRVDPQILGLSKS